MENNCQFCQKVINNKGSLVSHIKYCKNNPAALKKPISQSIWTIERRAKHSLIMKNKNTNKDRVVTKEQRVELSKRKTKHNKIYWTDEIRKSHSRKMLNVVKDNPDSYSASNVSGRTKLYKVIDGFGSETKVKGTWELIVANWLNNQNVKWTNKIKGFEYEWKEKKHLYFPDFYLLDFHTYIEVKGFERERDKYKWKDFPGNLKIFKQKEIEQIKKDSLETYFKED